jgi:hypothetical protein
MACRHMVETFGCPNRALEIDRKNNNGHYEPGNVWYRTRKENNQNKRNTRLAVFRQTEWPYQENTVRRKLSEGKKRTQILSEAKAAVRERRKNWRGIAVMLASMTSSTAAPETAL